MSTQGGQVLLMWDLFLRWAISTMGISHLSAMTLLFRSSPRSRFHAGKKRCSLSKTLRDEKKGISMGDDIKNRTFEAPRPALSTATNLQNPKASLETSKGYVKPLLAELIGTFAFVFIGAGSIITNTLTHRAIGTLGIALAYGLALSIMITIFAATSGGHLNPAVTIAMVVTRRIAPLLGLLYIVAQLVGATLAGLLLRAVFPLAVWQAASGRMTSSTGSGRSSAPSSQP